MNFGGRTLSGETTKTTMALTPLLFVTIRIHHTNKGTSNKKVGEKDQVL